MMKRSVRCEFSEGASNKFWECYQVGSQVESGHGKIGGAPSTSIKCFDSDFKACKFYEAQLASKLKKGYVESGKAKILGKAAPKIHKVEMKAAAMKVMKVAVKAKAAPMKAMKAAGGGKLKGKILCFTGALAIKRSLAKSLATKEGAKVTGSVSHNTDILVVGKDAGSKIVKGSGKMQYWDEKKFLKTVGFA
ncbi:DNA ligase (Polydeoxyribonucleotide synthase [NAD(+)]) [Durusdinium trenchii]|uniref:DNA ligase (Polydeoxyribonucleotide synthase [NAD(+)]) n=1 Tax=Durusdinium trenchii TaxID=1381693 RepID=A0ABP0SNZ9_9DINO